MPQGDAVDNFVFAFEICYFMYLVSYMLIISAKGVSVSNAIFEGGQSNDIAK